MADYAPHYTARYRLRYSSLGVDHSMTFRQQLGAGTNITPSLVAAVTAFLDALASLRFTDWTVTAAEQAPVGGTVFTPVGIPTVAAGTATLPTVPSVFWPRHLSFPGRSIGGHRCIVYVFGLNLVLPDNAANADYRFNTGENTAVANAVAALNAGSPPLAANDGLTAVWKLYANVGFNDYWLRRARG